MTDTITYPPSAFFDIETLINVAQPSSILLIGNQSSAFLDSYVEQKLLLKQTSRITHIPCNEIAKINTTERHDVAIAIDIFEHLDKQSGMQLLSRLRDLLAHQYCICLPITKHDAAQDNATKNNNWGLNELFGFALERVALYAAVDGPNELGNHQQIGLFKYNINDYKKTPDWLNADNWANPEMWEKYRW